LPAFFCSAFLSCDVPHDHELLIVIPCSVADCVVVTATRDGMNLVPYEYIVCRQGPDATAATETEASVESGPRDSMLVVSGMFCSCASVGGRTYVPVCVLAYMQGV